MNLNGKYVLLHYYLREDMTVDEKCREVKKNFPFLSGIYEEDLRIWLGGREYLPVVKGVQITTKFGENEQSYIAVIEMPEQTDMQKRSEVQKAFMRICGRIGEFSYDKWGVGGPNETIMKHLKTYLKTHEKNWIRGEQAGYPRVITMDFEIIENAPNEAYEVIELTGFQLD